MARNKKHKIDKFYTKDSLSIELIKLVHLSLYDLVIEPSAGSGSFSRNINHSNLISLDIEPEAEGIIKMNWFDLTLEKKGRVLVIGNPPFGNQGSLALKFIKKCDELKVDTIAFILPKSFKKDSYKNKIPLFYHLEKEIDLKDDSYTLLGKDYSVPSIFQIWNRKDFIREKVKLKTKSKFIEFVKKSDNPDYSFRRVGFYAGMIYNDIENKSEQSHYFIKSSSDVKEFLENYKWEHNNTSGPRSIGKSEIINIIEEYKG
jgi:hypothetical protein